MSFFERIVQFLIIFFAFLLFLFGIKHLFHISDYVLPGAVEIISNARGVFQPYLFATLNTFFVALIGHVASILLAITVGSLASMKSWAGGLVRTASYNLQAYPVVAVSPIIFIFFGDGMVSSIIIASLISYFPLLLSFIGIFSTPVPEVEHFFLMTQRLKTPLKLKIRIVENLQKIITVVVGSGTLAMVGTIVAEFLASTSGIGYAIRKAMYQSNLSRILVALFLVGLLSSLYLSFLETAGAWIQKKITGTRTVKGHN